MTLIRQHLWDIIYAALLIVAVPVAIFHATGDRWPQAILVTAAGIIGAVLLINGWHEQPQPSTRPRRELLGRRPIDGQRTIPSRRRNDSGRYVGWFPMGVISGFVATGIMTGLVLLGYGIAALLASDAEGAPLIQQWSASLVDNTVTEVAIVNPAIAITLHLVAGIAWGVIYAGLAEPRLPGSPVVRGLLFSLVPWFLSVAVFLPLVGAGFLGLSIAAGPLPVLGNLILHLAYGVSLGKMYTSEAIWDLSDDPIPDDNLEIMEVAQRSMAVGLLPGLLSGLLLGPILSTVVSPQVDVGMSAALGALVGSAFGIWVGSLAGLSSGSPRSRNRSRA